MLEVGAHQLCWLFLQELFRDASAPPTTTTASAISAAVFILSLRDAYPAPNPNNARLFARCDFPRPYAELIDIPVADNHFDRRRRFVTATQTLGVAVPFASQACKLKLDYVVVVNHGPSPSPCKVTNFCFNHGGEWAFSRHNLGGVCARSEQRPASAPRDAPPPLSPLDNVDGCRATK